MLVILIVAIAVLCLVSLLYDHFKEKREDAKMKSFSYVSDDSDSVQLTPSETKETNNEMEETDSTIGFDGLTPQECGNHACILQVLRAIGCQPESQEDGNITVQFQGETFLLRPNGPYFVDIYDLAWSCVQTDDPELPLLKEALIETQWGCPFKFLLRDGSDNAIEISTSYLMWLHPGNDENKEYMRTVLRLFFLCKDRLHDTFLQMRARQQSMN